MLIILMALVGLSLGILIATSSVPQTNWAPLIGCFILTVAAIGFTIQSGSPEWISGIVLTVSLLSSSSIYSGYLWSRENLEPGISVWGWVVREITNPRYIRHQYAEANTSVSAAEPIDTGSERP